jgi:hypothetical protein
VGKEFDAADAHFHHRIAEFRIIRGDDDVAGPGQHQAAGDAFALHGGDGRLGHVAPTLGHAEIDFALAGVAPLGAGRIKTAPGGDLGKILPGLAAFAR